MSSLPLLRLLESQLRPRKLLCKLYRRDVLPTRFLDDSRRLDDRKDNFILCGMLKRMSEAYPLVIFRMYAGGDGESLEETDGLQVLDVILSHQEITFRVKLTSSYEESPS